VPYFVESKRKEAQSKAAQKKESERDEVDEASQCINLDEAGTLLPDDGNERSVRPQDRSDNSNVFYSQLQMAEQQVKPLNEAVRMALTSGEHGKMGGSQSMFLNAGEGTNSGVISHMATVSTSVAQPLAKQHSALQGEKITSDVLLQKIGETDTQWASRLVQLKVSARSIEQATGIPRSRIAKWPSYRKSRDEANQAKADKIQGKRKAAQLMGEKDIVTHKDLVVISRKTGIPSGTLRRMDEYRARRPEKSLKTMQQDKIKAKALLLDNHPVRDIAKKTGVAESTLHGWKHDLKKIEPNDVATPASERESVLKKKISNIKQEAGTASNTTPLVQKEMKMLLNVATDNLELFVQDRTTTAIGIDSNNKYYLSSSSYPSPRKLQQWARSQRITVVENEGHAEVTLINNVRNIIHIEPSRDVCIECEYQMLKHHVTTSRPFSHKLSQAQRTGKSYTEHERQVGKAMRDESAKKVKSMAEAKRLLTEGNLSLTDIGRKTGVNKSTMVAWPEHKIWLESQKKYKADDPRKVEAVKMSLQGISQNEIAKKLKASKTKISQWIKESKLSKSEFVQASTSSEKRAAIHQGLSATVRSHMQASLRNEIRAAGGINQQGLLRWLQEPGMSRYSYHDILDVLEEEEIDFEINDFINAWSATGRPLPNA